MRKLVLLGLILSLLFTLPMTASSATSQPFSATLAVEVTDPGTISQVGNKVFTTGETLVGQVLASDWPELVGASVIIQHSSRVRLDPATGQIAKGRGQGDFQISKGPGDRLEGSYTGQISGNIYSVVSDEGRWVATKGTGLFARLVAEGDWKATLYRTAEGNLAGTVELTGVSHLGR